MSDMQAQPFTPAHDVSGRTVSVWVWLAVLLVAVALLGGAVWWVGGPAEAMSMLGLSDVSLPSFLGGSPSSGGKTPAAVTDAPEPSEASSLPPSAQERMFVEQVESRVALGDLTDGRIASLSLGTPTTVENTATVPLTARYEDGSKIRGTMTLAKYEDLWYFFSLGRSGQTSTEIGEMPTEFDSDVVAAITQEQAKSGTQDLIKKGVLEGGFTKITVDAVQPGPGTAAIDVTLSEGSDEPVNGRLVCISKTDAGTTYWFVASFEKR